MSREIDANDINLALDKLFQAAQSPMTNLNQLRSDVYDLLRCIIEHEVRLDRSLAKGIAVDGGKGD